MDQDVLQYYMSSVNWKHICNQLKDLQLYHSTIYFSSDQPGSAKSASLSQYV